MKNSRMEAVKTVVFCIFCSQWVPFTVLAQTGSSFFYYYSPNQPMRTLGQTFGQHAQAYHHSSRDPYSLLRQNIDTNRVHPSSYPQYQQEQRLDPFPTQSPFIPQRNAYSQSQSSLLDKITFTNGPPSPTQQPQYHHYTYQTSPQPMPQSPSFPGQTQPSPKLFNFLNQPFQFFQNNFGNRFQQQTVEQAEQNFNDQPQVPQTEYVTNPSRLTPTSEEQSRQNFYTYYERGNAPSRFTLPPPETPKSTPLTFSVNQYFTAKTSKGPASYTFTIEANPTIGPTATVQVNVGSDSLPATFPTLPAQLFIPRRRNKTRLEDEQVNEVKEILQSIEIPVTPSTTTTTTTTATPIEISSEAATIPSSTTITAPETSSVSTFTPLPEIELSSSTTSPSSPPSTTEQINLTQESVGNARKPVKRVIIRKKGRGPKRIQGTDSISQKNELKVDKSDSKETVLKPQTPEKVKPEILSTTTTPTTPTPLSPTRKVKKPRFKSTTVPTTSTEPTTTTSTTTQISTTISTTTTTENVPLVEEIEPVTTHTTPQEVLSTTEQPRNENFSPTTFRYNTNDFYEPISTTTEIPVATTDFLIATTEISSSTLNPQQNVNTDQFENDEYEYVYYDEEKPEDPKSVSNSLPTEPSSTEHSSSTSTTEASSTTTTMPTTSSTEPEEYFVATTLSPMILEDEEIIEPLSTTEPILSQSTTEISNTDTNDTAKLTEKVSVTTENILVTTYRQNIEPEEISKVDYDNAVGPPAEVRASDHVSDDPGTESSLAQHIDGNVTLPINTTEASVSQEDNNYDFPDENYSQEDERIQEAQRQALQTALKNLRIRQQNVSSTTEKAEEENSDLQKKFVRRPTQVNAFPSSTSTSVSYSANEEEELGGNSRTNVIRKIQTFRKKYRKVVSGVISSTTKRPRRVTRPFDTLTSSTPTPQPEVVADVEIANNDFDDSRETQGLNENPVEVPKRQKVTLKTTTIPTTSTTTTTESLPSTPESKLETSPEPQKPAEQSPKVFGSLIITEILPSSTTEAMIQDEPQKPDKLQDSLDFETESEDELVVSPKQSLKETKETKMKSSSSENLPSLLTEISSLNSDNFSNANFTQTESIVETATSRTIRERKVKVVLKRRKNGTGTVARQVVRTRTRSTTTPPSEVLPNGGVTE